MRRPTYSVPLALRAPLRHIWRGQVRDEADLLFRVRDLADQGDRINLIRRDGLRFTIVRNGECYLVRDEHDKPLGTFDTIRECIAAGDKHLDFRPEDGPDDFLPKGAA